MIVLASCRCFCFAFSDYFCAVLLQEWFWIMEACEIKTWSQQKTSTEKCVVIDLQTWNFNICNYFTASSNFQILKREDNYHLWKLFSDMIFRNIHVMLKFVKKKIIWTFVNKNKHLFKFWNKNLHFLIHGVSYFHRKKEKLCIAKMHLYEDIGKKNAWVREEIII